MKYVNPRTIYSPRDMISEVEILFEDPDSVSIAKLKWNGEYVIGIRWNIAMREWDDDEKIKENKVCLGLPTSRSYPTWFLLPEGIRNPNSELSKVLNKIKL